MKTEDSQTRPRTSVSPGPGVEPLIRSWCQGPLAAHISHHEVLPPRSARTRPLPGWIAPGLRQALAALGLDALYEHQARSLEACRRGEDLVVATPTASGKTLCYNLPVFHALLEDAASRALYLFPTKALARDQVEAARRLACAAEGTAEHGPPQADIGIAVYDGDTPVDQRRSARKRGRIIATNPDMLHAGILPHHPSWAAFFAGLRYVVVDELHTYRGVFGSHLAHVLRRLLRVARLHGARPQLVATSATIANPLELAQQLFGRRPTLVQESGAPSGRRHFLIVNPPLVDPALGLRESPMRSACRLVCDLVQQGVGTLVFCRSRLAVEVMVRELRHQLQRRTPDDAPRPALDRVRGYRGGYLPNRRREVERALRGGDTDVVVTTNALELGIDIGALDAVVMVGWPGSRAAAWQRAGRAGRRLEPSLALMVASSEPVDQFVAADPAYLFGQPTEHARVNPDNPSILVPHLKCAAAEIPFAVGDRYGECDAEETREVLDCLAQAELLHRSGTAYHYTGQPHPAAEVHLRGHLDENFLVVRQPDGEIVAEVDYHDAPQVLHENAIYQLEGRLYEVLRLDHDQRKAHVATVEVDYYTDAMTHTRVRILEQHSPATGPTCHGEVHVVHRVVGFKKIRLHTGENVGYGDVTQPEREMHTTALWLSPEPQLVRQLAATPGEIAAAAMGAAYALHSVAALLLMSDPRDLGRAVGDARSGWFAVTSSRGGRRPGFTMADDGSDLRGPSVPMIFLFDRYPGGTGLSDRLYEERAQLLGRAARNVAGCQCREGCPGCVGAGAGRRSRQLAAQLLLLMLQQLEQRAHDERQEPAPGQRAAAQPSWPNAGEAHQLLAPAPRSGVPHTAEGGSEHAPG